MKSIKFILLSYFQQNFLITLGIIAAIFAFIFGNILTLTIPVRRTAPEGFPHWIAFLVALILIVLVTVFHLRELVKSRACSLYPYYYRNQLIVIGLILLVFLFWPAVVTGIFGFPVLISLAMFLLTANLILWLFFFIEPESFFFIAALTILYFCLRLFYELFGLTANLRILKLFPGLAGFPAKPLFLIIIILFSVFFLILFIFNFSRVSNNIQPVQWSNTSNFYFEKLLKRDVSALLKSCRKKSSSLLRTARLLQPGLFEPYNVFISQKVITTFLIFFFISIHFAVYICFLNSESYPLEKLKDLIRGMLFVLYVVSAFIISVDFLKHRDHLPQIWMQAQLNTRKEFAGATILSYLIVSVKTYLSASLAILAILAIIPDINMNLTGLLSLFVMGFVIFIFYLSFTLIFSEEVVSRNCTGWIIANSFFLIPVMVICVKTGFPGYSTPAAWSVILIAAPVSLLLLRRAFVKWSAAEMSLIQL